MRPSSAMTGTCASSSLAAHGLRQIADHALGVLALGFDRALQLLVGLRFERA